MNNQHRATENAKGIAYNRLVWQADNAPSRNRYAEEEEQQTNARTDKARESFICVVSFIAIMILACIL